MIYLYTSYSEIIYYITNILAIFPYMYVYYHMNHVALLHYYILVL